MVSSNSCGSCRRCCQGTLVRARASDIERWQNERRYDIIICLKTWVDNSTFLMHKNGKDECVFLTENGCDIYETRPEICREFPKTQERVTEFNCLLDWKTHEPKL